MTNKAFVKRLNALMTELHELTDEVTRTIPAGRCDANVARNRFIEAAYWLNCAMFARCCKD